MSEVQWLFSVLGLAILAMLLTGAWDNRRVLLRTFGPAYRRTGR